MKRTKKRGAILITAVVLAMGVAIALGTFIALSVQASRLSNSSFHFNSALNLAEAGLERAMVALNTKDWSDWSTETIAGHTARTISLPSFDLGGETKGYAKVAVFGAATSSPRVVAEGRTEGNLGSSVRKQLEIFLRQRSDFENGLVAKNKVSLVGNGVTVDSYDSRDTTKFSGGQFVEGGPRNDNGSVASAIVEETLTGADLGNADIWGMVATSGSQVIYKPNGTVLGEDSAALGFTKVDPNRITHDFVGEFEPPTLPNHATWPHITNVSGLGTETIGGVVTYVIDGATTPRLVIDKIDLSGNQQLLIRGDVELVVPTYYSGADSISVTGNAKIIIEKTVPTDVVDLYVHGNVKIAGNGIANTPGFPRDLRIHGTNDVMRQEISLAGNGQLKAAVNAPNANVTLGGGGASGAVCGAIVGYNITLNGHYPFHYDEALKDLGDGNPLRVGLWRELTKPAEMIAF